MNETTSLDVLTESKNDRKARQHCKSDTGWITKVVPEVGRPQFVIRFRARATPKVDEENRVDCCVNWKLEVYEVAARTGAGALPLSGGITPCGCGDTEIPNCGPGQLPNCNNNPPICIDYGDPEPTDDERSETTR